MVYSPVPLLCTVPVQRARSLPLYLHRGRARDQHTRGHQKGEVSLIKVKKFFPYNYHFLLHDPIRWAKKTSFHLVTLKMRWVTINMLTRA